MTAPLRFQDVSINYELGPISISAVDQVTLEVAEGEILGLVGESGSGKSTLAYSAMSLLPTSARVSGEVLVGGRDIGQLSRSALRGLRGSFISLIPQDALSALDPTFTVGSQIAEVIRSHQPVTRRQAKREAIRMLEEVGIPDATERANDPPHRFSGGMTQRVAIAIALANNPRLVIADEPTTSLDVTIQGQILALIRRLQTDRGMSVLLITHDLGVVAETCDRVAVMYAGQVVEIGTKRLFTEADHPYTNALLEAMPTGTQERGSLRVIEGEVPDLEEPPAGCRFAPRCRHAMPRCSHRPEMIASGDHSSVACWYVETTRDIGASRDPHSDIEGSQTYREGGRAHE